MKMTLYRKLIRIMLGSTLILLIGVGYAFFYFYQYNINQQAYGYTKQILADATVELNAYLDDLAQSGERLANQDEIVDFMAGSTSKRFALSQSTRAQITSFANYKPTVTGIYLRSTDGTRISAKPDNVEAYGSEVFRAYLELVGTNDLATPTREVRISKTCRDFGYFGVIVPVFRAMAAPQSSDFLGSVLIICDLSRLEAVIPPSARAQLVITEEEWIVYCGGKPEVLAAFQAFADAGRENENEVVSAALPRAGWMLHVVHSSDAVMQRVNEMGVLCILIAALAVAVQLILLMVLQRSFVNPIVHIARQAERVNRSGDHIQNPMPSSSEFTMLTENINGMFDRIESLNRENLRVRTDYYKERILLLQMQINPHFLYNNLECIRGMAVLGHENEIREIVSLTANIYRYCTNAEHMVRLASELECVRSYARIMALRYDNQYEVRVDVEEDLQSTFVPKMLLQPLVENAYTHGFIATNRRTGRIVITAWRDDAGLYISVEDDGSGIPEEKLAQVNSVTLHIDDAGDHIGVANVRSRLRMIFGENGTLEYTAKADGGTIALVRIVRN